MGIKDLIPMIGHGNDRVAVRRNDADSFRGFQREMNRLFDAFFDSFPLAPRPGERFFGADGFTPRLDVSETDREIKISAELPGMDEKDITVEMRSGSLVIRGEKTQEKEDEGRNWHIREQAYGSFQRSVALPAGAEGEKAGATFKKGILTITVPKKEEEPAKRKTIKIETN